MEIQFNFNEFINKVNKDLGNELSKVAKKNIKRRSPGRVYLYRGRPYIASKPGDAPNIRSGDLYKSVGSVIEPNKVIIGEGNNKVNYASFLEGGTSRMDARPNLKTLIENNQKLIYKNIDRHMRNFLKCTLK